jgi:hypothetical protein
MKNDLKMQEKFLREIGLFAVQFSYLEFGLTHLSAFTCEDIRYWEVHFEGNFGLSLESKRDLIKKFIKSELPHLLNEWESINTEIGKLNHFRRHLIHGTGDSYLFHPKISTCIKNNKKIETMKFTVKDINILIKRIDEVCTGYNGIHGVFSIKFKYAAINWYNKNAETHKRIIYQVNNEIITEWKG